MHKNDRKTPVGRRRAYEDIIHSLLYGITCICSGEDKSTPNKERKWAKKTLTKLGKHKKQSKKIGIEVITK
jgi:hypothetical protein